MKTSDIAKAISEFDAAVDQVNIAYQTVKVVVKLPRSVTSIADAVLPVLAGISEALKQSIK